MDHRITKFHSQGSTCLWFFPDSKHNNQLHICFDETGRNSWLSLLQLMDDSKWPSKKKVKTTDPLTLGHSWVRNWGDHKVFSALTIDYRKGYDNIWDLDVSGSEAALRVGDTGFKEFQLAIEEHLFDAGIGEDEILMFW